MRDPQAPAWRAAGGVAAIYIINRHGSLIYNQDFQAVPREGNKPLSSNDKIRLASTFIGCSTVAAQLSPAAPPRSGGAGRAFGFLQPTGILTLDADTFRLQCFHTATGMKLFAVVLPPLVDCNALLREVYGLYSDYVLKNPFYELDMPVRIDVFDKEVKRVVMELNVQQSIK
uniref:Trafficking protein particle complex subunit n=1 Tax=Alexandrium monilatum TaxID=311494 RepID=A0A7S4R3N7_9DINO|mmetsp:Transcript_99705/g.307563  ORF Transcript_99705/g.307563 Transcript_99705/m.307563 type:complete len:172 (+) Transcript_99705:35-550(+)